MDRLAAGLGDGGEGRGRHGGRGSRVAAARQRRASATAQRPPGPAAAVSMLTGSKAEVVRQSGKTDSAEGPPESNPSRFARSPRAHSP